jgi:hypothetical protein
MDMIARAKPPLYFLPASAETDFGLLLDYWRWGEKA